MQRGPTERLAPVFGIMAAVTGMFYAWAVSGPTWAISIADVAPSSALWAGVAALAISTATLPLFGALSDRYGRRWSFYIYGFGVAVTAFPLNRLASQGAWQFGIAMTIALILFAAVAAILPAVLAELFPTEVRAAGIAIPYSLSAVAFGGTAPYLLQWTARHDLANVFTCYLALAALLGAAIMRFTPETAGTSLLAKSSNEPEPNQEMK
ncbi:MFS transporter [Nocardia asteroides]|nr:MFS transporter [Nocardia asteroides]